MKSECGVLEKELLCRRRRDGTGAKQPASRGSGEERAAGHRRWSGKSGGL